LGFIGVLACHRLGRFNPGLSNHAAPLSEGVISTFPTRRAPEKLGAFLYAFISKVNKSSHACLRSDDFGWLRGASRAIRVRELDPAIQYLNRYKHRAVMRHG
jgi:hypothetical protein